MSKLLEKMAKVRHRRAVKANQGLETLLGLDPLDESEFLIFVREESLLMFKMKKRVRTRTPEETLQAVLATAKSGFCHSCYVLEGQLHLPNCPKYKQ